MKVLITFAFIALSTVALSQHKTTLFLIGDSTMADKKNPTDNPEYGWGQLLPELMTDDLKIDNHAKNGRSSKSFIDEGLWENVRSLLKEGDYVFIQFGHNDQKIKDSTRYTNPFTQYRANLETFVKETREAKAHPVLFSSIVRRNFNEHGVLVDTHGQYPLVVRMVAESKNVPFVDLQLLTEQLELKYGQKDSKNLHLHLEPGENKYIPEGVHDDTHLSRQGATLVATMALQAISTLNLSLASYIRPEVLTTKL